MVHCVKKLKTSRAERYSSERKNNSFQIYGNGFFRFCRAVIFTARGVCTVVDFIILLHQNTTLDDNAAILH